MEGRKDSQGFGRIRRIDVRREGFGRIRKDGRMEGWKMRKDGRMEDEEGWKDGR